MAWNRTLTLIQLSVLWIPASVSDTCQCYFVIYLVNSIVCGEVLSYAPSA